MCDLLSSTGFFRFIFLWCIPLALRLAICEKIREYLVKYRALCSFQWGFVKIGCYEIYGGQSSCVLASCMSRYILSLAMTARLVLLWPLLPIPVRLGGRGLLMYTLSDN
ncbi:hypothetical protein Droror1_Dr00022346 [Drosera rotundifolia]